MEKLQRPTAGELALIVAAACCAVVAFHRETVLSGFDTVQADVGDSRLITFLLEHWHRAFSGHATWSSPSMFYPVQGVLGYSDMLFGSGVIFSFFRFLGAGMFKAANMTMVTLSIASYASAYWLLRRIFKANLAGSILGALFFAFCYPKFMQLGHMQLRFDFFQPLALGAVAPLILEDRGFGARDVCGRLSAFVALFCLGASTAYYNAWFFGLLIAISVLIAMANSALRSRLKRRFHESGRLLLVPVLLAGALLLPFFLVYLPQLHLRQNRDWSRTVEYIPTVVEYAWLGPEHVVWGKAAAQADRTPSHPIEKHLGIGLVGTAFILAAWAWAVRWGARSFQDRRATMAGHFVSTLLIGSLLITVLTIRWGAFYPWRMVHNYAPGASVILAVGRWVLTLVLPISIAIAFAADWLQRAARRRPRLGLMFTIAIGLVLCVEQTGKVSAEYSGKVAEQYHAELSKKIPPACDAFFLAPADARSGINFRNFDADRYLRDNPDVAKIWRGTAWEHYKQFGEREGRAAHRRAGIGKQDELTPLTLAEFDSARYLAANPDVALNWRGTAWEHYQQFGLKEGRSLDRPAGWNEYENFHYQLSAMLVSAISGKPSVNGASGLHPKGYELSNVFRPDREQLLQSWLKNYPGKSACLVSTHLSPSDLTVPRRQQLRPLQ